MNFKVAYKPADGYWKGGKFFFDFKFSDAYPHKPPSVKVSTCTRSCAHQRTPLPLE